MSSTSLPSGRASRAFRRLGPCFARVAAVLVLLWAIASVAGAADDGPNDRIWRSSPAGETPASSPSRSAPPSPELRAVLAPRPTEVRPPETLTRVVHEGVASYGGDLQALTGDEFAGS